MLIANTLWSNPYVPIFRFHTVPIVRLNWQVLNRAKKKGEKNKNKKNLSYLKEKIQRVNKMVSLIIISAVK